MRRPTVGEMRDVIDFQAREWVTSPMGHSTQSGPWKTLVKCSYAARTVNGVEKLQAGGLVNVTTLSLTLRWHPKLFGPERGSAYRFFDSARGLEFKVLSLQPDFKRRFVEAQVNVGVPT